MTEATLYLKPRKEQSLQRFHPWVFSGAIKRIEGNPQAGDIVTVCSNKGRFLARGIYSDGSIVVRVLSFKDEHVNTDFVLNKLKVAWQKRVDLGLVSNPTTNIFRWCHAEGDGLPSLIIDVYGNTAVILAYSKGMHQLMEHTGEKLMQITMGTVKNVYDKSGDTLKKIGYESDNKYIIGSKEDQKLIENSIYFKVDWERGQKTGFFIDQRVNRLLLQKYSKGKNVLNTFCYTGGFSLYALAGDANNVISLDSSQPALDMVLENIKWNHFEDKNHEIVKADAVDYLKELPDDIDLIILDPPAFAKHMSARHSAIQGYKRINGHAIKQIKPGGIIFTFSCSQVISKQLFRDTVTAAAINAGRNVRVLHQLHQPADHPINIYHPEGEYLKGLVLQVE